MAERPEPMARRRYGELIARVGRGMFPRTADFRALLGDQAEVAVEALQALTEYAATGEVDAAERVAAVEKRGDRLRERNLATLNRAFTTTYDRDLTAVAIRRIDEGTSLVLHLAIGWWIGFLLLVNVLGLRINPPRGDNWAGNRELPFERS